MDKKRIFLPYFPCFPWFKIKNVKSAHLLKIGKAVL